MVRYPRPDEHGVQAQLGEALRAVRHSRRYTLEHVELLTCRRIKKNALSSWERGDRVMSVTTLLEVCAFYRVDPGIIMRGLAAVRATPARSQRKPSRSLSRGSDNGTAR